MAAGGRLQCVIGTLDRGGTENHLLQLLPCLASQGWEISIYCLSKPGELAAEFERKGIAVTAPPLPGGQRRQSMVYRICRILIASAHLWWRLIRQRPDIVHFYLPNAYVSGSPVALLAGCRCLVMSRRSLDVYQCSRPALARIERYLHRWMSAICGNSLAVLAQLQAEGVPSDRLVLIYNGVLPPQTGVDSSLRASLGCSDTSLVFIVVANLIPYKGHVDLIQALASVRADLPEDWRLWLVGRDDGYGRELQHLIDSMGLSSQVLLLGSRPDVLGLLQVADIAILPSHQEGFSNAILEAMAVGLPVVASNVGGNAEAVADGMTGVLVPPEAPAALGEALVGLAGDPQRRKDWGAAGRQRALMCFGIEPMVRAYLSLYDALLTRGRPVQIALAGAAQGISEPSKTAPEGERKRQSND